MENNEKYIVDNIRSHREEIDLDGLWADVSSQIPKQKKRRRLGFWIFGGLAIVLLFGISWIMNTPNNEVDTKLSAVETLQENGNLLSSKALKAAIEIDILNKPTDIKPNQNLNAPISIRTEKNANLNMNPSSSKKHNSKIEENNLLLPNQLNNNQINNTLPPYFKENNTNQQNLISNILISNENGKNTNVQNFINKIEVQNIELENKKNILVSTTFLKEKELKPLTFNRKVPEVEIGITNIEKHFPEVNRWSAYIISGGAFVNRKLSARSREFQPELERREAVVDVLGSWEIEGGIGFRVSPKLKVMTGLNYTEIHEKASFETSYLTDYEIKTQNLIHYQDGSVNNETGTTSAQGIRQTTEIRYNQLRLFQIPLKVTYELLTIDRFKVNIGAFASYSIKQKYSGVTSFSASSESYNLDLDEENKFRKSGSMSYGLFLEGTTHLSRMVDLSFSLGYRQTNNINTEIYLIDQQYNSFSFTSGISRRF